MTREWCERHHEFGPCIGCKAERNRRCHITTRTRHGGNVGKGRDGIGTPFYLFDGQCAPEYDQGHSVVVWYDDLVLLAERAGQAARLRDAVRSVLGTEETDAKEADWRERGNEVRVCRAAEDLDRGDVVCSDECQHEWESGPATVIFCRRCGWKQ